MIGQNKQTTLDKIKRGDSFFITKFIDPQLKCLSTRFGMSEGQALKCIYKTPGGPVILQKKFQEIALSQCFSKNIEVQLV
jgi:Fe2+ transport system protein FeoA